MDFLVAAVIIAAIVAVWWAVTHHKPLVTPSGKDLANTLANATSESWEAVKRDLPTLISADLAQAKADLAAALKRAETAEQALASNQAAHEATLAAVASRVAAAVAASPEIAPVAPPTPVEPAMFVATGEGVTVSAPVTTLPLS